jgi:hypothetical protein
MYLSYNRGYMFLEKNNLQILKNNNIRTKLLRSNLLRTSKLNYSQVIAAFSCNPHFVCEFKQQVSSVLDCVQEL